MQKWTTLILIFLFPWIIKAQKPKNYTTEFLDAYLQIKPNSKKIIGKNKLTIIPFKDVNFIEIDAPGIIIKKVKKGWFNNEYTLDSKVLKIYHHFKKGKKYTFKIIYEASPKSAMYFTGWRVPKARKQIWTQGQGKKNSHWIPFNENYNDKFPWELNIDFDKNYQVISNGVLEKKKTLRNGLTRWTYKQEKPSAGYLMFIGVGKYKHDSIILKSNKTIYNYIYSDKANNDKTYYKSKEIFDFIEKEIGVPYAWPNYKQVPLRDFLYGGMENVSVSSFNGNRYVVDSIEFNDHNFINVSAHELAHQWFGDLVTGKTSSDHWLHEGFATYYARLNDARILGKDYSDYEILKYDKQIKKASTKDSIPIHRPNASSLSYYQKGARVVQMLREKTGDSVFRKVIISFLNKHKYKNVEIKDLQHEFFLQTGDSLKTFFKFWLDSVKIPELVLKHRNDSIIFIKNQIPQAIPFLFIYKDSLVEKKFSQSFKIPFPEKILSILPNTDNALLAKVIFHPEEQWVVNQILYSPYFTDKFIAINQLPEKINKDSIFNLLLNRDEFYPINHEIAKYALKNQKENLIRKLFKKGLKTRQYLAINMKKIPLIFKDDYKNLINDSSYITKEAVLFIYLKNFPNEKNELLKITQNIIDGNDKSFRLTWLTLSIINNEIPWQKKDKYLKEIIQYSSPVYNIDTRLNAFYTLEAIHYFDPVSIDNLIDASLHFNWHLHRPARNLLNKLYHQQAYKKLILNELKKKSSKEQSFIKKILNIK